MYTRAPYGLANLLSVFQQTMDRVLQDLPGTICFLDDVLVTGRTQKEHIQRLEAVLQRLQDFGFKLKKEKCKFFQKSISYLGYEIDSMGLHKLKDKINAIINAPAPTNKN